MSRLTLSERWARALKPEYPRIGNHAFIDNFSTEFVKLFFALKKSCTFHLRDGYYEFPNNFPLLNHSLQGQGIGKTILTQD